LPVPRAIDQGICLRHWDWSETSQTVSILTREHGVVRGLAKGARRDKAPFSGGIEIATRGELVFIPRAGGLATLASWDLEELFPGVRGSAAGFFAGMYLLDLAQQFVQEGDPHPVVFDTLAACLRDLGDGARAGAERGRFWPVLRMQWVCLSEAGVRPLLDRSAATGEALAAAASYGMSAGLGGLVVDPGAFPGVGVYRVRAETVELLRGLEGGIAEGDAAVVERAARLMAVYVHHVLGKALASAEALFGREGR
jgi:DNA repair protein RecO (recombination protein O)